MQKNMGRKGKLDEGSSLQQFTPYISPTKDLCITSFPPKT